MKDPIKVLIVDDSSTMRQIIRTVLEADPGILVVGSASDAAEARQAIKSLNPDVVTLDIEMPGMNGIEFLEKIMRLRPMPVIMVSTLTDRGTDATLHALELGAIDCVVKPNATNQTSLMLLPDKVKAAAQAKVRPLMQAGLAPAAGRIDSSYRPEDVVVAIGSSTGGVEALAVVLAGVPSNCPPIVITQHMPPNFTRSLADRLNRSCPPTVVEASHGAPLSKGHVYIAPGGDRHLEIAGGSTLCCALRAGDPVNGHRPSVDVLFNSVARAAGKRAVGVILTGMGGDGAEGLLHMRQAGARTIGQDERTCVVYGMPRVAHNLGAVERQLPLGRISEAITELTAVARVEN
ncbi:MAG: chemotaxis response regulator protein-glutamate methylesterase [Proteobacteria bacterium]|nr:chemotaxis response regulator protein-glutamate methylesterase [Pseudomonadota bacterium]